MAIKDKDGKVYKLRGPNPLVKNHIDWDRTKIRLINLGWRSEIVFDEMSEVKKFEESLINIKDKLNLYEGPEETKNISPKDFLDEINSEPDPIVEELQNSIDEIEKNDTVIINVDKKDLVILKERGVEYYCSPVIGYKKHTDAFYGSSYETPKYGETFVFDAIILDQSDLQLQIWCVKNISINSIIYKKVKSGGERWWRVGYVEEKTGGYLCMCFTSDVNPDFSKD